MTVSTGLDRVSAGKIDIFKGAKVGLLAHPASIDKNFRHAVEIFNENSDWTLSALFGPQHGWDGSTQDNMIEWEGGTDVFTGCKLYSLYGKHRKPTTEMLEGLDLFVVDLQDVGTRVYTFIQTLYLVIQACGSAGISVVVLDRPNPIGGTIEGPMLFPEFISFVGLIPLPLRHGMTIGELAQMYGKMENCEVEVIAMQGWKREMYFDECNIQWAIPSPNMPTLTTAIVYPGTVLFEGTNVSEGRGTTRPFEFIGAPKVNAFKLAEDLNKYNLPGVSFRSINFEPTFNKHGGNICSGVQIYVTDRNKFQSVNTGCTVLKEMKNYFEEFNWTEPPYEYENEKMPIDIIWGSDILRNAINNGESISSGELEINAGIQEFKELSKEFLIYE